MAREMIHAHSSCRLVLDCDGDVRHGGDGVGGDDAAQGYADVEVVLQERYGGAGGEQGVDVAATFVACAGCLDVRVLAPLDAPAPCYDPFLADLVHVDPVPALFLFLAPVPSLAYRVMLALCRHPPVHSYVHLDAIQGLTLQDQDIFQPCPSRHPSKTHLAWNSFHWVDC